MSYFTPFPSLSFLCFHFYIYFFSPSLPYFCLIIHFGFILWISDFVFLLTFSPLHLSLVSLFVNTWGQNPFLSCSPAEWAGSLLPVKDNFFSQKSSCYNFRESCNKTYLKLLPGIFPTLNEWLLRANELVSIPYTNLDLEH